LVPEHLSVGIHFDNTMFARSFRDELIHSFWNDPMLSEIRVSERTSKHGIIKMDAD
jgi:hypothetical protein